jgi:deoxyribose-phosphate aldolase
MMKQKKDRDWSRNPEHWAKESESSLRKFLLSLPDVDGIELESRARKLMRKSAHDRIADHGKLIKEVEMAISLIDLTSLEISDTKESIIELVERAKCADSRDQTFPPTAAVCVFGKFAHVAKKASGTSKVRVAAVAGGFPHGRIPLPKKLKEISEAIDCGADEVDMVFDRELFNNEKYGHVFEEIVAVKDKCKEKGVKLKVILETGELKDYGSIRRAAWLSILAGADFVKTSTGKIPVGATPESTLLIIESACDWYELTGETIGIKPSGGVKNTIQALGYLNMIRATAGELWLTPTLFRFGASRLLTDLAMEREKLKTGSISSDYQELKDRDAY